MAKGFGRLPKSDDDVTVVGVAWFHPDQWQKLRTVVPNLDELHDSYQEWLDETEAICLKLQQDGGIVHRVEVDIDDLTDWCREHNRIPDASGRSEYAADRIQKLYKR